MADHIDLAYRLPVTNVTLAGTRKTIENKYAVPSKQVAYSANIAIQIEADPRDDYQHKVRLPNPRNSSTSCTLVLAPDGRLVSSKAEIDDQSQEKVRAWLKVGASAVGAAAPFAIAAFAPGAIPILAGAAAISLARKAPGLPGGDLLLTADFETPSAKRPVMPTAAQLGIEVDYVTAKEDAAILLANLRWSDARLQLAIASAVDDILENPLKLRTILRNLTKARTELGDALDEAEAAYARWLASHTNTTDVLFQADVRIEDLPTTAELVTQISSPAEPAPAWWSYAEKFHCLVTCDYESPTTKPVPPAPSTRTDAMNQPSTSVTYRVPSLATITHWTVEPTTDDNGRTTWKHVEVLRERNKLILVAGSEAKIALEPKRDRILGLGEKNTDAATELTFNADGILTQVATKRTDPSLERATTIGTIPDDIKDAIAAAKTSLKPFTVESETARLNNETALLKAKSDLKKQKGPSPKAPLESLRAAVEEELNARKARAEAIASNPTSSLVTLSLPGEPAGAAPAS